VRRVTGLGVVECTGLDIASVRSGQGRLSARQILKVWEIHVQLSGAQGDK
jgi:hypothetical protein